MYIHSNLVWVKNVTRKHGAGWAYDDKVCNKNFMLNWPTRWRGTAETPKTGDIILLFQKPKFIGGRRNYDVHLTHLVTPVSEVIHEDKKRPDYKWCREVKPIAIADPIDSIPNPGFFNFFKPNRGQTHPITNLENTIGLNVDAVQAMIWDLFSGYYCVGNQIDRVMPQLPFEHPGWYEGDKIVRKHVEQELTKRSAQAIRAAKLAALRAGNGRLSCECCKFDFFERYGKLGERFIEGHHKEFLSSGARYTRPEHIALVCANCHRMLHTKNEIGHYLTVAELTDLIKKVRQEQA